MKNFEVKILHSKFEILHSSARLLFLALSFAAIPASADEFRPRATVSYESRESGPAASSWFRREIEVFLTRHLSDPIELRLRLGASQYDTGSTINDASGPKTHALLLRPDGALRIATGRLISETRYHLLRTSLETEDIDSTTSNESVGSDLTWTASKWIPSGTVRVARYRVSDTRNDDDLGNDLVAATLTRSWSRVQVSGSHTYRSDRSGREGFDRSQSDTGLAAAYVDSFAGGRFNVNLNAGGTLSTVRESAAGGGSRIPNFVPVTRAYWVIDDTPLESFDHPLVSTPSLVDTRVTVPTGISLGPDSASFQTIAFELARISPVDEIRVIVRDDRGELVLNPGGIRFDVYTSLDGERWVPHIDDVEQTFEPARSEYQISFASVDVRWIKVVTFGVAGQPVLVTEAHPLFHVAVDGSRDFEYGSATSSAVLTYMPARTVTLNYVGAAYASTQDVFGAESSDVRDFAHSLSMRWDPRGSMGYEIRGDLHDAVANERLERSNALTANVRWSPRPQVQLTTGCEMREDELELLAFDTRTCSAMANLRIFPTLDVAAGGSHRVQDRVSEGGEIVTRSATLSSMARLTPRLRLTIGGSSSQSTITGDVEFFVPPVRDDRVTADLDWNAGSALGLGAAFGWVGGDNVSGVVQRYRIRWNPFGGGSVSLNLNYTQDIDPYTNGRSERILFAPRWQINPVSALSVTWMSVKTTGVQEFESDSILAALTIAR